MKIKVLNLGFKINFLWIIVDDGSKDNSVVLIKSFCEKDERIKLYQHKNCENKGLAESLKSQIKIIL